jgi:hypothetical protein
MAVGRITGPLLASNLLRDGVNLAVETNLLYLDVTTGRIGIKTASPQYDLDVNGTANVGNLIVQNTSTFGLLTITKTASSGTIGSTLGPIHVKPAPGNEIKLDADTTVDGNLHATGNITADGNIVLGNQLGVDTLTVGAEFLSSLIPKTPNTYNVGSPTNNWKNGYFQQVQAGNLAAYGSTITNLLASQGIDIAPKGGPLNVRGEIRVWGQNPLGTAPVTSNILYVTEDGSDTNDGGAMDPSRACRTVSGATKSPLYKEGTSIKVAPGLYRENNPVLLKQYTSVIGSDLRTTLIEPMNKTQDLFHVQSGCYIAQLMTYNGRSGRFPGGPGYAPGTNRGAYATAFPPQVNGTKIDLFHSPYIQNVTNQSGPWLYDGTMFVPNQTIQIPEAIGTATYPPNTTTFTVTLSTGSVYVGQSINGGPPSPGFQNARTLLLANKAFIQEQTVAYVDQTYGGPFQYNAVKCARDTGLIVDGLGLDLIYQGTSQSVFSGLQYWNQSNTPTQIPGEVTTTTNAFNYISGLAQQIVRNIVIAAPYQNTLTQVTNLPAGAVGDSTRVGSLFTTVTNIITYGTAGITDKIIPNGTTITSNTSTVAAYNLLQANKNFLKSEVIAWINVFSPGSFVYDKNKCKRDLGYIIDCISFDLLRGGNRQAIQAGTVYYGYNSSSTAIPNEIAQTTMAYQYMKSVISAVVQSQKLTSFYQSKITQVLDNANPGSATAASTISSNIDLITRLITVGPAAAPSLVPIGLTQTSTTGLLNAYALLNANKNFIKAEVIAYTNSLPNFVYNREKCKRDVGIILENVSFDALVGGNAKAIESGLAYFNGVNSVIAGQETQSVGAINYVMSLTNSVIVNMRAPNLLGTTATQAQVINYSFPGGSIAQESLNNAFETITNIITNGPSVAPESFLGSAPDPHYMSAEILLQANRSFIQEEVVTYLNEQFLTFPFNTAKCRRDSGLIVDSIALDLLFPTATDSQSNFAGLQYWSQSSYTGSIASELTTTTNSISYLSSLAQKIILNDVSGPRYQSVATQNTSVAPSTAEVAASIGTNFSLILDIINNGTVGITDKIVPSGLATKDPRIVHAYTQLQNNKAYLQAEVVAFVESTKTDGFVYDQTKCSRDVGYMVDSISFDCLYGGNRQSIMSGVDYYSFSAVSSVQTPAETTATIAAYTRLSDIVLGIITATPVGRSPNNLIDQVIDLPPATGAEVTLARAKIAKISNIITNGPSVASTLTPISLTQSTNENVKRAYALLEANRDFIANELVQFAQNTYNGGGFQYNQAKCSRDTGLLVDGFITDLGWSTNGYTNTTFAGLQYWNQSGYTGIIGAELTTTTNAINFVKTMTKEAVVNTVGVRYQNTITQIVSLPSATLSEASVLDTEFKLITDILTTGTVGISDKVVPNGLAIVSSNAQNAYNILQTNKAYFQAEAIAFVETTKTSGFVYDKTKCARDVGYMIDSVCFDLLWGGNRQAITSGVYYYSFSGPSAIPGENQQTLAAYLRLGEILGDIITNSPIQVSEGNLTPQQFNNSSAVIETASALDAMVRLLLDIINNGPSAVSQKLPVGLTRNEDQNILNAQTLLTLNKQFIRDEIIAYVNSSFPNYQGNNGFNYDQEKCYRDTGLIIDAISQDLLVGGNRKIIEAGESYWTGGRNVVYDELPQFNAALTYLKSLSSQIVQNQTVTALGNAPQTINTYFGGGIYAIDNINRLIDTFTTIVTKGPAFTPIGYEGAGAFSALSPTSADYTQVASTVLQVDSLGSSQYRITLDVPTQGPGINQTIYFGQTSVYPLQDKDVPDIYSDRKVDPWGSIGGSLVDGGVISDRSPIQSFVYDAFTQVNQGGIGIHITNNGYAQLVSVFTIFCGTSVLVENGGICSITNSNANFGDYCLVSKGYGKRSFFGEVTNPPVLPYYPNGFFPQNQRVEVYCPDPADRPHIGQVMEVEVPETYRNAQGLPGFLSAIVNTGTLTTGSISISGIDTTGIVIGQSLYARDQFGSYRDLFGNLYISTGTTVTDVNFKEISLSQPINAGGGDPANVNFFTMYVTGNAYYTIRGSTLAPDPIAPGTKLIGASATEQGNDQTIEEIQAITYLSSLTNSIVSNKLINAFQSTITQFTNIALATGGQSTVRMGQLFTTLENIINTGPSAVPTIAKTGIVAPGANDSSSLLRSNKLFLQTEIVEYINSLYFVYDHAVCKRDLGYILDSFAYDVAFQSNYQAIKSGQAYNRNIAGSKYVLENEKAQTTDAISKLGAITNQLAGISTVTSAISVINLDAIYIQNIINAGDGAGPAYSMPAPAGLDSGVVGAISLINNNISFITEELIGWINYTYPVFTYDSVKCKRDMGYVLDAVRLDILLGTNYRAVKAGQAYYLGNAGNVLTYEKSATIAAFNFIKSSALLLPAVVASPVATTTVNTDIATINNILQNGVSVSPTVTYTLPSNIAAGFDSASLLLQNNIAFIQAEVEAYVYTTYSAGGFVYDRTKCKRDVGYLMQALIYDITYGGNSMSVDAALQYFDSANNNVSTIPNEETQTVAAINYINTICQRIIINLSPLVSYQSSNIVTQYKNNAYINGANASSTVALLITEMSNIVGNGPRSAPIITTPDLSWVSATTLAAGTAINANANSIASQAITYIGQNFDVFTYDQAKCRRDIGYVLQALIYDLTYGGNWQTVDSGKLYWNGATSLIPNEQTQTIGAWNQMLYLLGQIIQNQNPANSYQATYSQFTNGSITNGANALPGLTNLIGILTRIIQNGLSYAPTIVYPSISQTTPVLQGIYNIIQSQKTTLINQVITYIDGKYNGFEYNQALCKRDVGYIIDAVAADLESGGNYNTVLAGQSYYARAGTHHYVELEDNITDAALFPDKALLNFYQRSYMSASGYLFEYVGAGSNYGALPQIGRADPIQERETIQLNNGKVFFTSTDQNGDFRIGPGLVISQATGVLSGRTFTKSLFANLTPFILAIEGI